ncbi:TadE/TadG family type IV pilus assembly protein [Pilimelia columellifera]|uniref:TadE-like domain-containing protein n=1 Tax=Pilimelia columellifera subsp. columellifera TaxID=706583 RepID=A0ABN3NU09_9ACTN
MRATLRFRQGDDRGAAAVEMALVLPLLLLMLFGIIDFGRMFNAQIALTEAAREGARAESLGAAGAARIEAVLGVGVATPVIETCPDVPGAEDNATVELTQAFDPVTPLGPMVGGIILTATGVMPCAG